MVALAVAVQMLWGNPTLLATWPPNTFCNIARTHACAGGFLSSSGRTGHHGFLALHTKGRRIRRGMHSGLCKGGNLNSRTSILISMSMIQQGARNLMAEAMKVFDIFVELPFLLRTAWSQNGYGYIHIYITYLYIHIYIT